MKIYIVENVRPNMRVFATYEQAFAFAKKKADKRGCPTSVWFESAEGNPKEAYHTASCGSESHINLYEREVEE